MRSGWKRVNVEFGKGRSQYVPSIARFLEFVDWVVKLGKGANELSF